LGLALAKVLGLGFAATRGLGLLIAHGFSLCPFTTFTETPVARYLVRNPRYYLPMPFTHGGL
jgi:hypothetical protein